MPFKVFDPADPGMASEVVAYRPGIAFPALHGPGGEDGTIQGFFESLGISYVGCGVAASAVCMNKLYTKWAFESIGVPTPRWSLIVPGETPENLPAFPLVAKPLNEGSSVGVEFVDNEPALRALMKRKKNMFMVEERIFGRELTIPLFGDPLEMFPIIEIRPKADFFDYTAKYTKGMTEYICPADVSPALRSSLRSAVGMICRRLDLRHLCRIDVMVGSPRSASAGNDSLPGFDPSASANPYFLEINTMPGMTETSLLPMSAKSDGIEFPALIKRLVKMAGGAA